MAYKKKSWKEKLEDSKAFPKILEFVPKFPCGRTLEKMGAKPGDSVVLAPPLELDSQEDMDSRESLGLGTDLGGYAIMVGGTSGPHLTSFSLVDVLSHGRACAIMSPYYTVFFAPAIQK